MSKEDRKYPRLERPCDLSQFLKTPQPDFRCLGVNVSEEGLGVLAFSKLEMEAEVTLKVNNEQAPLKVIWCREDKVRENIFHIGFARKKDEQDLSAFIKAIYQKLDHNDLDEEEISS